MRRMMFQVGCKPQLTWALVLSVRGHFVCMELVFQTGTEIMLLTFQFAWAGL